MQVATERFKWKARIIGLRLAIRLSGFFYPQITEKLMIKLKLMIF